MPNIQATGTGSVVTKRRLLQLMQAHQMQPHSRIENGGVRYIGWFDDVKIYFDVYSRNGQYLIRYNAEECDCGA